VQKLNQTKLNYIMDNYEEDGPILAAPHYYFGVCGQCQNPGALKRCSRCHLIFYCSSACQKAHWKFHKSMCNYFAKATAGGDLENFFSGHQGKTRKEWNQFRMNAVKTSVVILSRQLRLDEQEMFLFPRVCRTTGCFSPVPSSGSGEMLGCCDCLCVVWCSDQCRGEGSDSHKTMCRQLRLARIADRYESQIKVGIPSLPSHLDKKYLGTAPDITHFIEPPFIGGSEISNKELEFAFLTNQLSGPLTLLDIGHRFLSDFGTKLSLTVHIVGANVYEVMGIIKWEYLAHRMPSLKNLTMVFVGPDLDPEDDGSESVGLGQCEEFTSLGRETKYVMKSMTYSKFKTENGYSTPDMVLIQNCGFHEYEKDTEEWKNGWEAGIASLSSLNRIPVIFTSYTKGEAQADLKRFLDVSNSDLDILVNCAENSMRSHRPIRDWEMLEEKDVFYSNQYFSVVMGSG